ncbi:MAG: integrase [Desulfobacteraceae bacterium]|nr:integrase [Desulfobacteraceae bacterium]
MNFHCYLLNIDEISKEEFEKATENKKFFWEEYILPKYPNAVVEQIRTEARISPIPVWDPVLYEGRR